MERVKAYILIGLSYIIACICGYFIFTAFDVVNIFDLILALFVADIAMTIIIWIFGLIFNNSSFYDPYWSLIPWLMILFIMIYFNLWSTTNIIFIFVFGIWSHRLTVNWAYTCKNIKSQDWRYIMFKENNKPFIWHMLNFFGINIMPTILVFSALIPAIILVIGNYAFNNISLIGFAIIICGATLQHLSDLAIHKFLKNNRDTTIVMNNGLWKYSRHPNYFGEVTIWLGVYITLICNDIQYFYLAFGFILIFCLFMFVSIPMMEKRQLIRRPNYHIYQKKTSKLFFLPERKIEETTFPTEKN